MKTLIYCLCIKQIDNNLKVKEKYKTSKHAKSKYLPSNIEKLMIS